MIAKERLSPRSGERGFTLVEALISIVLMAVIIAVLASGMRFISAHWERSARDASIHDMFSRGINVVARDIEGIVRAARIVDDRVGFLFIGEPEMLRFIGYEPPFPTEPGPYVIGYSTERSGDGYALMRARLPLRSEFRTLRELRLSDEVVIMDGPYRYRFSYAEVIEGETRWHDAWRNERRLPSFIRLEVEAPAQGRPVIPALVVRLRNEAEPSCVERQAALCTARSGGTLELPQRPTPQPSRTAR